MQTKKLSVLCLVTVLILVAGTGFVLSRPSLAQVTTDEVPVDSIVKAKGMSTLYYYASDGKRYVFANQKTYDSWFSDFSDIHELEMEEIYQIPLGGNVRYRPGVVMVKITTDPKVYAVGQNGVLRWVKTEAMARHMYGENWNQLVDDVPDAFFTNYTIGDDVESEDDFDPDQQVEETTTINGNRGLNVGPQTRRASTYRCRIMENNQESQQQGKKRNRSCASS